MHPTRAVLCLAACAALAACGRADPPLDLAVAAAPGASLPRLARDGEGTVHLSWVETAGETHRLRFSVLQGQQWSAPLTVASGDDWFLNWADFPAVAHLGADRLVAHWLRKLDGGPYAYELRMSVSVDGGANWSEGVVPHADDTATEHGFATLFPVPGGAGAAWLDGRHTAGGHGHEAHGAPGTHDPHDPDAGAGAMTLRAGGVDWSGQRLPETELDGRVCDCCGTASAVTPAGVTVIYRGRSEDEIRDIRAVTLGPAGWSAPVPVGADGWRMPACPVNGPALAAAGSRLAAAWFTAAGDRPRVMAAFSDDGAAWSAPVEVAAGATQGRVAIVMPEPGRAVVSWLEGVPGGAEIRYRSVPARGRPGEVHTLAATSQARGSGFPQMALGGRGLVFAWTRVGSGAGVATATVPLP